MCLPALSFFPFVFISPSSSSSSSSSSSPAPSKLPPGAMAESTAAVLPSSTFWAAQTSRSMASLALRANNACSCPKKTDMAAQLLFSPLAAHLYSLSSLFRDLQHEADTRRFQPPPQQHTSVAFAIDSLLRDHAQLQILDPYYGRCSLYLLLCFPDLHLLFQTFYLQLAAAIDSLFVAADWSAPIKSRLSEAALALRKSAGLKLSPKEQSLHDSLSQWAFFDSMVSVDDVGGLATKFAKQVAESLGFESVHSDGFAEEIQKLKIEKASAEARRGAAHGTFVQRFLVLLDTALASSDADPADPPQPPTAPPTSAGTLVKDTLIQPLRSFICPITQEVMQDPVQIASGQTYERKAIERWFADGHTRCPTGGMELANTNMKSNIALKHSIEEWKERNNNFRLIAAREHLSSSPTVAPPVSPVVSPRSVALQTTALHDIKALCREDSLYKYRAASNGLVPLVVEAAAAESGDVELRRTAFSVLSVLADNEDCQEIMVREKVIELVVRLLARRQPDDDIILPTGVSLMCSLSAKKRIAERISHTPSAVLFLVTLINDPRCGDDVKQILSNLPKTNDNAIIMAEANIIGPLIERLIEGDGDSKVKMAETLGRLQHLPDGSKKAAASRETMATLAKMLQSSRREEREAALCAMESLSTVAEGRRGIHESGALGSLVKIIKGVHQSEFAKQSSAATLANLWSSDHHTTDIESPIVNDTPENDDDDNEDQESEAISCYLHLLAASTTTTPVGIQLRLLQGLSGLARGTRSERYRNLMKDLNIFACLIRLFLRITQQSPPPPSSSRTGSLQQLLCPCLDLIAYLGTQYRHEAAEAVLAHAGALQELGKVLRQGKDETEVLSAMSVLACLSSKNAEITRQMQGEEEMVEEMVKRLKEKRSEAMATAAGGALLRFTRGEEAEMQARLGGAGVVHAYVELLKVGNEEGRRIAAKALANFSKSTAAKLKLLMTSRRRSFSQRRSGSSKEAKTTMMAAAAAAFLQRSCCCCCGGVRHKKSSKCEVHGGRCSAEDTFCLVSAGAVPPLVEALSSPRCRLEALHAIATLFFSGSDGGNDDDDDDTAAGSCDGACSVIDRIPGAFRRIIALLASSSSGGSSSSSSATADPNVQKLVLCICQKLFSVPRFRAAHSGYAQIHIITLVQSGTSLPIRQLAASLLRDMQLLQSTQSYFSSTTITAP